ncbi:hypothetical protein BJ170DRAFT_713322 [Xylariales sp. AK1849]|nr:hypothetical protein BJ170DRAFT_713322 [Xylariales sp. AK1849]
MIMKTSTLLLMLTCIATAIARSIDFESRTRAANDGAAVRAVIEQISVALTTLDDTTRALNPVQILQDATQILQDATTVANTIQSGITTIEQLGNISVLSVISCIKVANDLTNLIQTFSENIAAMVPALQVAGLCGPISSQATAISTNGLGAITAALNKMDPATSIIAHIFTDPMSNAISTAASGLTMANCEAAAGSTVA